MKKEKGKIKISVGISGNLCEKPQLRTSHSALRTQ